MLLPEQDCRNETKQKRINKGLKKTRKKMTKAIITVFTIHTTRYKGNEQVM